MKVSSFCWTAFRLPFRRKFSTSRAAFTYREGLILQLRTDAGIVRLGEASPLLQDGEGSLQNVLAILDGTRASLIGKQLDELGMFPDGSGQDRRAVAAVRCALDVAASDATAKAAGITVARFLAPHVSRSVAMNATVGAYSTVDAYEAARKARAAGFGCVKLKVGMARSVDEECERVVAVRDALGQQVNCASMPTERGWWSRRSARFGRWKYTISNSLNSQ